MLYLISLLLRYNVFSGSIDFSLSAAESVGGAIVGFVGLACVLYAAYLGGDLVFANATGVNHTAFEPVVEDFERVAPLDEVPQHTIYKVMAAGVPVILIRMGTNVYAIGATCTHDGGPLNEGELQGEAVQCPWHGSRFNVKTGRVLTGPATVAEPRYDARVRDGYVEVKRHQG
jgi:nitrite reductase/ring-hydroxylating ferredoxin subunit